MTPSDTPDISICIANYNGGEYVRDCLASVYAQKGNFKIEVLLHDDCSTDDSLDLVRREFPNVITLQSQHNVGFCISNNRMLNRARGRYALLLNNDAKLRLETLQSLLAYANASNDDCLIGLPQYSLTDSSLVDRGYRTDIFLNPVPITDAGTHEVGVATGACLWIPRSVWEKIGGFPDWFESVAEDIYLCLAARLLGYRVVVLDAPGFDHWIGMNLGGGKLVDRRLSTTVRRRALSERNKTFAILLGYPMFALVLVLPLHMAFLSIEALFLLITGTGWTGVQRIYISVPIALWRQRRKIAALRAHLQRQRRCTSRQLFAQTTCLPQKLRLLLRHGLPELR